MKKKIIIVVILISLAAIGVTGYQIYTRVMSSQIPMYTDADSIQFMAKVDSEYFYIYQNNQWQKKFIKGVNIGVGVPGYFPGEFGANKEDYLRWFKYIGDMNANTIRVYTILNPDFYNALLEYNQGAKTPLFLIQGVWVNEEDLATHKDAYNPIIKENFKSDIETTIDVLHGNKIIAKRTGHASGVYEADVSSYVIGYILGIEWDPGLVMTTIKNNPDKNNYDGKYLYSSDASPFENFLCESGDDCITYETEYYQTQKTVSFVNWLTTDTLSHPNEPLPEEDQVAVNTEHIKKKDTFKPGLFASYHIYPYYPDFMNYQKEYVNNKDANGHVDTYAAYLNDLKKQHTVPILVAEFGIPAGRGKAHDNIHMGFNQGNVSETQQGEMDAFMLKDIYDAGYAGGLVFAFQDEWFKRTWNTMDFDLPERRPYWNNPQTNEQHFGLMAFDSGEKENTCYVDGEAKDWEDCSPISSNNGNELYVKFDETYMYFMVKTSRDYNFDTDTLIIPLDTLRNQGNTNNSGVNFDKAADFLISINGKDNSRIMVDPYYDSFQLMYGRKLNMIPQNPDFDISNSGKFVPMYLCLNKELFLPVDKVSIPFSQYETGKLVLGDGNPNHSNFNSLTDFCVKDNIVEIRIPWQLLNFMDPSTKMVMNDLHINEVIPIKTYKIYMGVGILNNITDSKIKMNSYTWDDWDIPVYHERLKQSYYILKDAFNLYQ